MALLDFEDFDAADPPSSKWALSTGGRSGTVTITGPRTAVSFGYSLSCLGYLIGSNKQTVITGARGYVPALDRDLIHLDDGSAEQIVVRVDASGYIKVYRGPSGAGTLLGTSASSGLVQINTVFHIEVKAKIDNSVGFVAVRINGVTAVSVTAVDTQQSSNAYCSRIWYGGGAALSPAYWDDIYVCDDSGSSPGNDFLGECKAYYLAPNAAGDTTQFTPSAGSNFQNVDETPSPNDDADYNSSATVGQRDLYNVAALAEAAATIYAARAQVRARKDDAAARSIAVTVKSGATADVDSNNQALTTAYAQYLGEIHTVDPNTGVAWTVSGINAAQVGLDVTV
jgi:hypothetical protein